jgi:predicted lipoprotein with Yx(FWY)xxD motif
VRPKQRRWWCLVVAVLLLAACGDDGDASVGDGATVTVTTTGLGEVLTDGAGRTLYVFTEDEPGRSTCTGPCLTLWPRYTPAAVVAGARVEAGKLGTIEVDGARQLTVGGMPLYHYAADRSPGDTNGHGVGGNWFAVRPDGSPVGGGQGISSGY